MTGGDNYSNSNPGKEEFEKALARAVYEAAIKGIDVEGSWDISAGEDDDLPDFSVEIYELSR